MGVPRLGWALMGFSLGLGGAVVVLTQAPVVKPTPEQGDTRPVVERIREVARLEMLDVSLHQKVVFEAEPPPPERLPPTRGAASLQPTCRSRSTASAAGPTRASRSAPAAAA